MRFWCLLVIGCGAAWAQDELLETHAMLYQAEAVGRDYSVEIAKAPPPSKTPLTVACLQTSSNWLRIDLALIKPPEGMILFDYLATWLEKLQELGITGLDLRNLKKSEGGRIGIKIDPRWGDEQSYLRFATAAQKRGITLMSDVVGPSTGMSADFFLALRGFRDYPSLYCLIEVDPKDWGLLPQVGQKQFSANVPWLTLQNLHQKGYIPRDFSPYVKQSDWNATGQIFGADGKMRRWVYLRDGAGRPILNWLTSSFASERLAAGDAANSVFRLGQKILEIDGAPKNLSLLIRKMGAYSAAKVSGGIESLLGKGADLFYDHITPIAFRHALVAEDAEALKWIYRTLLEKGVQPKRLVHALKPFESSECDWAELIAHPREQYEWGEEKITGDLLRERLLEEDIARLGPDGYQMGWVGLCGSKKAKADEIQQSHQLIAFAYAMQPGAFSIDAAELTGGNADLLQGKGARYGSLPSQLMTHRSFASYLRGLLKARRDYFVETADLIEVLPTSKPGLFLQLYQNGNGFLQLFALNFSREPVEEVVERGDFKKTSAINIATRQSEDKLFNSSIFHIKLNGWSGKVILFQPQYSKIP
ncbi:MAG: hypothetical protein JSS32_06875 [Verrucomicrobia bacterium]|nr:hypothetical protein [Verrucomicrobiota bacterium]